MEEVFEQSDFFRCYSTPSSFASCQGIFGSGTHLIEGARQARSPQKRVSALPVGFSCRVCHVCCLMCVCVSVCACVRACVRACVVLKKCAECRVSCLTHVLLSAMLSAGDVVALSGLANGCTECKCPNQNVNIVAEACLYVSSNMSSAALSFHPDVSRPGNFPTTITEQISMLCVNHATLGIKQCPLS